MYEIVPVMKENFSFSFLDKTKLYFAIQNSFFRKSFIMTGSYRYQFKSIAPVTGQCANQYNKRFLFHLIMIAQFILIEEAGREITTRVCERS